MTSCPYFNQGLFIGSLPGGETQISMCCWQQKKTVDVVDFADPYLAKIRDASKSGLPNECSQLCSIPGHVANEREKSSAEWRELFNNSNTDAIKMLHLEQSLTCNLACISCSTTYSSAWNKDYHHFEPNAPRIKLAKFPEEKWKNLDLTQLEKIHFTGGEPLLNADNKKILQQLENLGVLKNVMLSYNTNGTIMPDSETLRLWSQARFVRLFISLDGVGSVFEYTRYPANWQQVNRNIQQLREYNSACILIEADAIVGVHNIFDLPNFFDWWEQNCRTGSQGDPSSVFVREINGWSYGGRALNLKYLSDRHTDLALDMLYLLEKYPGVTDIIQTITNLREPSNDWINYLNKLDTLRKTNWQESLPEQLRI